MIPDLDENGKLPAGIYTCGLEEVENRFVYNQTRKAIFGGLQKLIAVLRSVSCGAIYLDGSFVTSKNRPGDVDVCWQEATGTNYDYEYKNAPILNPTPINRKYHKEVFKADIFPADIIESQSKKYFIDFFQEDKDTGQKKGILKIDLL